MLEREIHQSVSIQVFTPHDIPQERYDQLGLIDLMKGYGFTENLKEQARTEYGDEEEGKYIFLAIQDGRAIGSLVVGINHSPSFDDQDFYSKIEQQAPSLAAKLKEVTVCNIHGIVTAPEARGKGLASKFLEKMIVTLHPAVVQSQTKTPAYTAALSSTLARFGFRTWYGETEVTPSNQRYPEPFVPLEAITDARRRKYTKGIPYFVPSDVLLPYVPDVSQASHAIQEAYRPIISAQETENALANIEGREPKTAVLPCVAICVGN